MLELNSSTLKARERSAIGHHSIVRRNDDGQFRDGVSASIQIMRHSRHRLAGSPTTCAMCASVLQLGYTYRCAERNLSLIDLPTWDLCDHRPIGIAARSGVVSLGHLHVMSPWYRIGTSSICRAGQRLPSPACAVSFVRMLDAGRQFLPARSWGRKERSVFGTAFRRTDLRFKKCVSTKKRNCSA